MTLWEMTIAVGILVPPYRSGTKDPAQHPFQYHHRHHHCHRHRHYRRHHRHMRYATLYTQSKLLMLLQVFKITSSESFSVLPAINKYPLVFLLMQIHTYHYHYHHHYQNCDHYHDNKLIIILLQTHVEPLSSRVDCEGSSRQEVERGFELPPAIYQVSFADFYNCICRL